jgi:ActR/RegA family two-component response regulator
VGSLAASVAHSVSGILRVIHESASAILQRVIEHTDAHENAERIVQATRHAEELTRRLVRVAGGSESVAHLEDVPLREALNAGTQLLAHILSSRRIHLRVVGEERLPSVRADRGQLVDTLISLLLSSAEAMPDGGTISLQAMERTVGKSRATTASHTQPGTYVALQIQHTGSGMGEDVAEGGLGRSVAAGAAGSLPGSSLTAARNMVGQWGGWLSIRSRRGEGITVRIYMPKADVRARQEGLQGARRRAGGQTVLLIDDDGRCLQEMKSVLENAAYRVHTASTAAEGVALFAKHARTISLAVVDLLLPDADEAFVIQEIFRRKPRAGILLTSGFSREYVRSRLPSGAWNFLQKPFEPDQFLSAVDNILNSGPSPRDGSPA